MTTQPQQVAPPDPNDVLMGNGDGPSAPFLKMGPATFTRPAHTQPGEFKGGRIVSVRPVQAHKLGAPGPDGKATRVPQFYQSGQKKGSPIYNVQVILQTTERDPQIEGDDGLRTVELDGFDRYWEARADYDCRKRAARLAVTAAGATKLDVGGELYLAWERQVAIAGIANPAIHWVARYTPPNQSFTFDQPEQAAPAPVQQQPVQQQPVQQPVQQWAPTAIGFQGGAQPQQASPFASGPVDPPF